MHGRRPESDDVGMAMMSLKKVAGWYVTVRCGSFVWMEAAHGSIRGWSVRLND
jgi:hypothetical protein